MSFCQILEGWVNREGTPYWGLIQFYQQVLQKFQREDLPPNNPPVFIY